MKRIESVLISIFVLFWLVMPLVSAYSLSIKLISQDPMPVESGEAVDLLFKADITNPEKPPKNLLFKIFPEYPFSLIASENDTREFGNVIDVSYTESFTFKYRILVDKNANEGDSEIKVGYSVNEGKSFLIRDYNISVTAETRTDFDVVVQDSTAASTTLAIANIGANTGYSVIVRIPEQENFRVIGVSANVLGNLDAGDYTLATFQITPRNITGTFIERTTGERTPIRNITNIPAGGRENLVVEISYTDTLGIRRTIQREVKLDMSGITGTETRIRSTQGGQLQIPSGGLMYIGIGIVGIIVIVVFFKFRKRKKK